MMENTDLFNFDDSFVAKIIAKGQHGTTIKDLFGNVRTIWGNGGPVYK